MKNSKARLPAPLKSDEQSLQERTEDQEPERPAPSRRDHFAELARKHGWHCMYHIDSPKDITNPFRIEIWSRGTRTMLVQVWSDGSGVGTYFYGGGETWEQLEVELAREFSLPPADAPCSELIGAKPLVLYFADDKERDEFVALVKEAKPNMIAKPL